MFEEKLFDRPSSHPDAIVERRSDGVIFLRSTEQLGAYARCTTDHLVYWGQREPQRRFLAKRGSSGEWQTITYGEALDRVSRICQALLNRGLSQDRPIAILSGNDLEHALLSLAAQHVGITCAPISPSYSLVSSDFVRLKHILAVLSPGMIFASSGSRFNDALSAAAPEGAEIVVTDEPCQARPITFFNELEKTSSTPLVNAAHAAVTPDTVAKILFTSGSTGLPKGVVTTHRMLCSNQQMISQSFGLSAENPPPVFVDWLPWHHTFGGSFSFGASLFNGGMLYIDDGRALPGAIEETVRNLREVAPSAYFNVPRAYELLIPYFRAEPKLRDHFFSQLKFLFYAAASLSQPVRDSLLELARESGRAEIPFLTSLGATETAPAAIATTRQTDRPSIIGLPMAGVEAKLVPLGNKLELRVRGPNVMPEYFREPEKTADAFDEDRFYKMGDAVRFADSGDPLQGLEFDGRIAEDFKLSTGTWVNVGAIRLRFIQCGEKLVRDLVVAGHDRNYLSAIIFPDIEECRRFCPELPTDASAGMIYSHPDVRRRFQKLLDLLNCDSSASSSRMERALLMEELPSIDANEITDKGTINQRAVLERRADLVQEIYEESPSPRVIVRTINEDYGRSG
jgi:feruloyl-CoA synthase